MLSQPRVRMHSVTLLSPGRFRRTPVYLEECYQPTDTSQDTPRPPPAGAAPSGLPQDRRSRACMLVNNGALELVDRRFELLLVLLREALLAGDVVQHLWVA